jgi:hypothetical protein
MKFDAFVSVNVKGAGLVNRESQLVVVRLVLSAFKFHVMTLLTQLILVRGKNQS